MLFRRMFFICFLLIFRTACSETKCERQALLGHCRQIFLQSEQKLSHCPGPQIEMTSAAGNLWQRTEPLLYQAAEFRLKTNPQEARNILRDIYELGGEVETIQNASWENTGSVESMNRYVRVSSLIMRQVEIFLASPESYSLWQRLKSAKGVLRERTFELHNGKTLIDDNCYGQEVTLELILEPAFCFSHAGSDYAILTLDLPQANNSNYLARYLGRLQQHNIEVLKPLGTASLQRIEINGNLLILHYLDNINSRIDLSKQ